MSCGISPWVYLVWDSFGFLDFGDYFLPHFREFFNFYLLNYVLMVFIFVFWDSFDLNVGAFNIVSEISEIVLISFNFFFFFPLCSILSSTSLILSSASIIPCWFPLECFLSHLLYYSLLIDSLFLLGPC